IYLATESLIKSYSKNFDRSSKAVCRTALDFMLNECLTVLVSFSDSLSVTLVTNLLPPNQKGNHVDRGAQETNGHQQKTPTSWDDVKIYGEIAFNHKTLPRSKTLQPTSP